MTIDEIVLAVMALIVGVFLAWRSEPVARVALFLSALLVSAMLFLPGSQLRMLLGREALGALEQLASDTPWRVSDWLHLLIFVWLGFLLWVGRSDLRSWKGWLLIMVLAVAAEAAQGLAPEREPQLDDVLLNVCGGAVGVLIGMVAVALCRRLQRSAVTPN